MNFDTRMDDAMTKIISADRQSARGALFRATTIFSMRTFLRLHYNNGAWNAGFDDFTRFSIIAHSVDRFALRAYAQLDPYFY